MKIVLAYSGGLDTSVLLSWIKEKYDAEMIAFCANIGQEDELRGLEAKAKKTGASKIYIDDLQEEFARDFIFAPAALYVYERASRREIADRNVFVERIPSLSGCPRRFG